MAPATLTTSRPGGRWHTLVIAAILAGSLAWTLGGVGLFRADPLRAARNLGTFFSHFFPPNLDPGLVRLLWDSLVQTLQMAYAGTLLGAAVAIPFAALATKILSGFTISHSMRVVLAVARTIPSIVWAFFFIAMVGLGPLAGTLGIAMYTLGYLGKLYYEAFEGTDPEVLEAVRATGISRWRIARHAVLPEAANPLLSQLLFIFEYNVRASSIVGFVGAGGIGLYMELFMETFALRELATLLLMLLVVVILIDLGSGYLRRRFLATPQAATAR